MPTKPTINLNSTGKKDIDIGAKKSILLPTTPLFCLNIFAQNKNSKVLSDSTEKAKLLTCLIELSKRSTQFGIEKALSEWNGKDYKQRKDWGESYGRNCYSLRTYNKGAYRICNSIVPVTEVENRVVFQILDIINEKN